MDVSDWPGRQERRRGVTRCFGGSRITGLGFAAQGTNSPGGDPGPAAESHDGDEVAGDDGPVDGCDVHEKRV